MLEQGAIYLVNLNPSKGTEAGKTRPVLVIQNNLLNSLGHKSTMILPLTTQLASKENVLRFRVNARDKLLKDSDIMLDQIRTVDNLRFCSEKLASLTNLELAEVKQGLLKLL